MPSERKKHKGSAPLALRIFTIHIIRFFVADREPFEIPFEGPMIVLCLLSGGSYNDCQLQ